MNIIKEKISEERLNVLIPKSLKKKYKVHCINNDFVFSHRIRQLIEMDLSGQIKTK